MQQDHVVLVLTSVPDVPLAKQIAHVLIKEGLAGCVSLGSPTLSVYAWKGKIEEAEEIPLTIKTTWARGEAVIARLISLHPYEVPEAIIVPVASGHGPYLDWVRSLTVTSAR